jgi:hypothetical protein
MKVAIIKRPLICEEGWTGFNMFRIQANEVVEIEEEALEKYLSLLLKKAFLKNKPRSQMVIDKELKEMEKGEVYSLWGKGQQIKYAFNDLYNMFNIRCNYTREKRLKIDHFPLLHKKVGLSKEFEQCQNKK